MREPSMHRHHPSVSRSPVMVEHQTVIDHLDVVVGWLIKALVRQISGPIKQGVRNFLAHARIFVQGQGSGYSQFPIVVFVHGETLRRGYAY